MERGEMVTTGAALGSNCRFWFKPSTLRHNPMTE
jgi:hypothetical protein